MAETAPATAAETPAAPQDLDAGNYEVLRQRLLGLGRELHTKAEALNARRKQLFGGAELAVAGSARIRTENNCVPRDIVALQGGHLLVGYNVFVGLKTETRVADVFSLQRVERKGEELELQALPEAALPSLLDDPAFKREFQELHQYYKEARLAHLVAQDQKVLAVFRTGKTQKDVKVFRWSLDAKGVPKYVDNRGERDYVYPPSHDFSWTQTSRDDHVRGKHPHVSLLDLVFVETVGGDLTVKVEDNTEDGLGIYREPVEDKNQSLDDALIYYAKLGGLVLFKILPYRETEWRHFVFNTRTQEVLRVDAIAQACVQLPEDHGIIFPGGYYLQTGARKLFDGDHSDLELRQQVRSPNGEDVLYVFHQRERGEYVLFPYNLIRKEVQTPIHCQGWTLFEDGAMLVFRAQPEATRVHPLQVWRTPFCTAEVAAAAPTDGSFLSKVGNADLVRGISEALSVQRLIEAQRPTRQLYEDLIAGTTRTIDGFHWLSHEEAGDLLSTLKTIGKNAELIVDEFEKVLTLRQRAEEVTRQAEQALAELEKRLQPEEWTAVEPYLGALTELRTQRGQLITTKEVRYVDLPRLEALEARLVEHFQRVSRAAMEFFLKPEAFAPLVAGLDDLLGRIEACQRSTEIAPLEAELSRLGGGLEVLAEVVGGLESDDPTARTRVLEAISEVLSHVNRVRATLLARKKELRGVEGKAEFGAQFRLFAQAVSSALALCDTPERCDEQLARLMLQLEELEGRFGELEQFLGALTEKRTEVYEAFDARRQALVDERQRRAATLLQAADRIVQGIGRKAATCKSLDELNAYFAADPMVQKLRQIGAQLLEQKDTVKSDEVQSRLKAAQQEALRALRDRLDLGGAGEGLVRFGRHSFNVHARAFELTLAPSAQGLSLHITGTDFHEPLDDPGFADTRPFWDQQLVSETAEVYRGEYLACSLLFEAEAGERGLSLERLQQVALEPNGLLELVRAAAADRYDEGYERGVHDADAALILRALLSLRQAAGLLRYPPAPRAWACLFWAARGQGPEAAGWLRRAASLHRLRGALKAGAGLEALGAELGGAIEGFLAAHGLPAAPGEAGLAGRYLVEELAHDPPRFVTGQEARELREAFLAQLEGAGQRVAFEADLAALVNSLPERFALAREWLAGFLGALPPEQRAARAAAIPEAVALLLTGSALGREPSSARLVERVTGLLGQHARVVDRALEVRLDEVLVRVGAFRAGRVPAYRAYRQRVRELLERERARLRLDELQPKVLTAFVRNRLIDEVYLHLIGANLAKQIGAAGDQKRTDLMGMLLLISPPGYGKTTLMEYVAAKLGLAFVKVNGPALGHDVTSLDPAGAPSATARQELEKVGLALEMGNNVMLYLDDIQHTSPELLQKFISLCDGSRRIEGVWRGRTRTYDLRGKKFCVCMAGNPYTESGARFQIPDMLANRADTYNLGDVLSGKEELFALSYLENSLTSNPTLAPLAARDPADLHRLIRMARGEEVPTSELSHGYSAVEVQEMCAVLRHLFRVQEVLLTVNQQYIASAAQADEYRTEPPFKLQGSYRNMNKVAEKVAPAMNASELEQLLDDHYQAESQTLTTGAEQNLLKLGELRGRLTPERRARWEEIKRGFARLKLQGGSDADPVTRVTGQLSGLTEHVRLLGDGLQRDVGSLREGLLQAAARVAEEGARGPDLSGLVPVLEKLAEASGRGPDLSGLAPALERLARASAPRGPDPAALAPLLERLEQALHALARPQLEVDVQLRPEGLERLVAQQGELLDQAVRPLAEAAARNLSEGHETSQRLSALFERWLRTEEARRVRLRGPSGSAGDPGDDLPAGPPPPPPHSSAQGPLEGKVTRRRGPPPE